MTALEDLCRVWNCTPVELALLYAGDPTAGADGRSGQPMLSLARWLARLFGADDDGLVVAHTIALGRVGDLPRPWGDWNAAPRWSAARAAVVLSEAVRHR